MKSAAIYKSKKKIIVHSYSKTDTGLSIAASPYFILDIPFFEPELINAIKQAVNDYKEGVPHPKDWSLFLNDFLQFIGLRRHNELQKNFSLCIVELINDNFEIIPTINQGVAIGFIHQNEKKVIVSVNTDEMTFIEAIQKAFTYCE